MYLIFIELKPTAVGAEIVKKAVDLNYRTILVCQSTAKYKNLTTLSGTIALSLFEEILELKNMNFSKIVDLIEQKYDKSDIKGIIGTSDPYLHLPATLSRHFGLPTPNPESLLAVLDKANLNLLLERWGYNSKWNYLIRDMELVNKSLIRYPCVIKPNKGFGSIDVKLLGSEDDFEQYRSVVATVGKINWGESTGDSGFLCEEFIEGELISVDSLILHNNITHFGITSRLVSPEPYFTELGASFPYDLPEEKMLTEFIDSLLKKLNFDFGIFHIELIKNKDGFHLIDFNPRMPGSLLPFMINESLQIDIFEIFLNLFDMDVGNLDLTPKRATYLCSVQPMVSGILNELRIVDLNNDVFHLIGYKAHKNIGDTVVSMPKDNDELMLEIAISTRRNVSEEQIKSHIKKMVEVVVDETPQEKYYIGVSLGMRSDC